MPREASHRAEGIARGRADTGRSDVTDKGSPDPPLRSRHPRVEVGRFCTEQSFGACGRRFSTRPRRGNAGAAARTPRRATAEASPAAVEGPHLARPRFMCSQREQDRLTVAGTFTIRRLPTAR